MELSELEWPNACPKCGHESDEMGCWYQQGNSGILSWCCWECNEKHPAMACLEAQANLAAKHKEHIQKWAKELDVCFDVHPDQDGDLSSIRSDMWEYLEGL
jgi:hypothetical protein